MRAASSRSWDVTLIRLQSAKSRARRGRDALRGWPPRPSFSRSVRAPAPRAPRGNPSPCAHLAPSRETQGRARTSRKPRKAGPALRHLSRGVGLWQASRDAFFLRLPACLLAPYRLVSSGHSFPISSVGFPLDTGGRRPLELPRSGRRRSPLRGGSAPTVNAGVGGRAPPSRPRGGRVSPARTRRRGLRGVSERGA